MLIRHQYLIYDHDHQYLIYDHDHQYLIYVVTWWVNLLWHKADQSFLLHPVVGEAVHLNHDGEYHGDDSGDDVDDFDDVEIKMLGVFTFLQPFASTLLVMSRSCQGNMKFWSKLLGL